MGGSGRNNRFRANFFFIGLFFVITFVGACGSKKSTLASSFLENKTENAVSKDNLQTDSTIISKTETTTNETKQTNTEKNERIIRIEFDTEKPLIINTGFPPLKMLEIKITGQKTEENTAIITEINAEIIKEVHELLEAFLQSQIKTDIKEQITETVEKKESQKLKWLAVIAVCAVIIILLLKGKTIVEWLKKLIVNS